MTILPKAINRVNATPTKLPMAFPKELQQKILQFVWKHIRSWVAKAILKKKNGPGEINLPDFKRYYKATVIKIVWYWHKNINIDQQNKRQGPQINPGTHGDLIFDKEVKNIQWRKHTLFNNWCWENWTAMCRRIKLEHFLTPYTIINSKSIKGLNVWPEAINSWRKTQAEQSNIHHSKILFDPPTRVMEIKTK